MTDSLKTALTFLVIFFAVTSQTAIALYDAPVFGGINLEDISAPRCFDIERRLKASLDIPVFHDDQHGTEAGNDRALSRKERGGIEGEHGEEDQRHAERRGRLPPRLAGEAGNRSDRDQCAGEFKEIPAKKKIHAERPLLAASLSQLPLPE